MGFVGTNSLENVLGSVLRKNEFRLIFNGYLIKGFGGLFLGSNIVRF